MAKYFDFYLSPIGLLKLSSDGDFITGLDFCDDNVIQTQPNRDLEIFLTAKKWLDIYFSGKAPNFLPKIKFFGTDFQMKVWDILLTIPYGKTLTYGDIAKLLSTRHKKMSAQAVGGAVGRNKINIIVPCHRVLGKNSALTGYAHGLDRKIALLNIEKIKFIP